MEKFNETYLTKLRELFKDLQLPRDNIVINIRGNFILARTYLPPSTNKNAFEKWFVENIESMVPGTPMADVVFAYESLASGRVLIAFARRREIEQQITTLKSCSITPTAIDASCIALFDAFSKHPVIKKRNLAVIDIGGFSTDFILIKGGEPFASNEIPIGGKDMDKSRTQNKKFAESMAQELQRLFAYYQKKENLEITDLIIVGDYAHVPGLKKNLKMQLPMRIEIGDPFAFHKISLPKEHDPKENPYYAQALGLTLKGLSKKGIDLTPYEAKEQQRISLHAQKIRNTGRVAAFFIGLVSFILFVALLFVTKNNTILFHEASELEKKKENLGEVINKQNVLAGKIIKLKQLSSTNIHWSQILYDIGTAVPTGVCFKEISTDLRFESSGTSAERVIRVVIDGTAANQNTVVEFIKNLEQKFKGIVVESIKSEVQCEFKISLAL